MSHNFSHVCVYAAHSNKGHQHRQASLAAYPNDGMTVTIGQWFVRLSPTGDSFENPNLKWVSNTIPIASNIVPIQKTHFGYQKRHNPNLGILSPRDPFAGNLLPVALPKGQMGLVFWVMIIGDSLVHSSLIFMAFLMKR